MALQGVLEGMRGIVTGGARGIGEAIASAMAEAGARVVVADLDGEAADRAGERIRQAGGDAIGLGADVGDVREIDRLVTRTLEALGGVDVLVNNAGVTRRADLMELTESDWDRIQRVNAKGVFFCLQRVAREMIPSGGGSIVNIASIAVKGYPGTSNAAYAASKGAVISLTRTAAQQLGRHDIRVNAICPGVTRTAILEEILARRVSHEGLTEAEAERAAIRGIPLRRMNEPADVAGLAVFLASPAARNITGQAINVDGGLIPW